MIRPLISIVVVNWNGQKWLQRCFDSLQSQDYDPIEIILVDNASSDDSVPFVQQTYPRVMIVQNAQNLGFASGVNTGLAVARGSLILLINNDTWVKPDFLSTLYAEYKESGYDVIAAQEGMFDGTPKPRYFTTIDPLGYPVHVPTGANFYLSGVCLLFPKTLYEQTGGLDDNFFMYLEETDWFWRLNLLDKRIGYAIEPHVFHAVSGSTGGQKIRYKVFLWRNQNTPQMLIKNYSAHNLVWVLPVYALQNLAEVMGFMIMLKPRIAYSYVQGWTFNLRHLRRTLHQRKQVQASRRVSDRQVMKLMYGGLGKLHHMRAIIRHRKTKP